MKSLEYSRLFLFAGISSGQLIQTDIKNVCHTYQSIDIGNTDFPFICRHGLPPDVELCSKIFLTHSVLLAELSYIIPNYV